MFATLFPVYLLLLQKLYYYYLGSLSFRELFLANLAFFSFGIKPNRAG